MKLRIGVNFWPEEANPETNKFYDVEFDLPVHIWNDLGSPDHSVETEERLNDLFLAMLLGRKLLR